MNVRFRQFWFPMLCIAEFYLAGLAIKAIREDQSQGTTRSGKIHPIFWKHKFVGSLPLIEGQYVLVAIYRGVCQVDSPDIDAICTPF